MRSVPDTDRHSLDDAVRVCEKTPLHPSFRANSDQEWLFDSIPPLSVSTSEHMDARASITAAVKECVSRHTQLVAASQQTMQGVAAAEDEYREAQRLIPTQHMTYDEIETRLRGLYETQMAVIQVWSSIRIDRYTHITPL